MGDEGAGAIDLPRRSAQRIAGKLRRSAVLPVLAGVVVGLILFVSATASISLRPGKPPAPVPPFFFVVNVDGQFVGARGSTYNLSASNVSDPNLTLGWIQFYVLTGLTHSVPFVVSTYNTGNVQVGTFNSSNSNWTGASSPADLTLYAFGGWTSGRNVTFDENDTFQLTSPESLAGYEIYVGMQVPGSTEQRAIVAVSV
jgi:hypothetical protein